jgi:hypothetical protein
MKIVKYSELVECNVELHKLCCIYAYVQFSIHATSSRAISVDAEGFGMVEGSCDQSLFICLYFPSLHTEPHSNPYAHSQTPTPSSWDIDSQQPNLKIPPIKDT